MKREMELKRIQHRPEYGSNEQGTKDCTRGSSFRMYGNTRHISNATPQTIPHSPTQQRSATLHNAQHNTTRRCPCFSLTSLTWLRHLEPNSHLLRRRSSSWPRTFSTKGN